MSDGFPDAGPRRAVVRGPKQFKRRALRKRLPSLLRRVLAGVVDLAVGGGLTFGLYTIGVFRFARWMPVPELPWIEHVALTFYQSPLAAWQTLIGVFVPVALMQVGLAVFPGRTLGEWLFRLDLVDLDGRSASLERRLWRGVLYLTWPLSLGWAPLFVAISRQQQGIHDALAGVVVVHRSGRDTSGGSTTR